MSDRLAFDRVAIAAGIRTAIVAPIACCSVRLEQTDQANAAKVWDASSGGNYKDLRAGEERAFEGTYVRPLTGDAIQGRYAKPTRFEIGDVVAYVEAVAGVGPISVEFIL